MKLDTRQKHWFFFMVTAFGAIVVVNLAILLMWTDMSEEERVFGRQVFGRVVTYGTLAMIVVFFFSSQFILYIFRNYISPIETLTEETRLIAVANAKYRIKPVGAVETHKLTSVINELADSYISLKSDVKNIVTESKSGLDEDKSRLATLMNAISEGVLICNHDGRILHSNKQSYEMFNSVKHEEVGRFSRLGLGRSLISVFNRSSIIYALEELHIALRNEKQKETTFQFITTRYKVQYLDVKISPILKNKQSSSITGYVVTFNDITHLVEENNTKAFNDQFIILDEVASIANMKTENQFNFITEDGIWLSFKDRILEDYLIELSSYLKTLSVKTISMGLSENNKLQINWASNVASFKSSNADYNKLVIKQTSINNHSCIELDVDVHKQVHANEVGHDDPKISRPIVFNSEMYDLSQQMTESDDVLLRDLTFVVFDTETTGLDPTGGDEIISIAGVRLHQGKISNEEMFDELVNPQRNIPLTSLKIHEIYPEMLTDKPTIDRVLPMFHEFAHNTVLVAHNAAFDMRFFQLKEVHTGVKFNNPVLDTLLLSSVCHPTQELHNLEDIAEKCGVEIIGRHTALGDSLVTAEVLLKLIPILEAKGIKTLGEAREASRKTVLSNLKF